MKNGIHPTNVWFYDDGNIWKFWVIKGCKLHFLTSEQAVIFRRDNLEEHLKK